MSTEPTEPTEPTVPTAPTRSGKKTNPNRYATTKTAIEGLVNTGLIASNVSLLLSITGTPGGVDTWQDIARVVLVSICLAIQLGLMGIFIYQGSQDIENLGRAATNTPPTQGASQPLTKEDHLNNTNIAANVLTMLIVLFEIIILAFGPANQA